MEENVTESLNQSFKPEKSILLTEEAQYYLQVAAKWGNFLAIVGFVMCGFILLAGLFAGAILAKLSNLSPMATPIPSGVGVFFGFIYVIIAVVYFFPSFYLYQFCSNAKKGIAFMNADDITKAMSKLKSCFKFLGILMIIFLSIFALELMAVLAFVGGTGLTR